MGLRGPQKTPTKILEKRGNWAHRIRKGEPEPESGIPDCPEWIADEAKKHYETTAKMLDDMGVLTTVDQDALTMYCEMWARWKKCEIFLQEKPPFLPVRNDKGEITDFKSWPQTKEASTLASHLLKLQQSFGLTPSARASLTVNKKSEKNETGKSRFFKVS